eukprot:TRINITY_DN8640_c0_g1_i1.p1 TRINITY_DN8640_c0_g1~~TRINITY_DN8640_c0_g1_i1.p1  ORF type:complete len:168 (-),score=30.39 TRINITY_DN8640_c0_g1_i1:32-535(-)
MQHPSSSRIEVEMRPVSLSDLEAAYSIESSSYPEDEAATYEKLEYRINNAGEFFLGAYGPDLLGFVCGTLSKGEHLEHHSMQHHDKDGESLCIHSVVVDSRHRHLRLGSRLLEEYVNRAKTHSNVRRILLITKPYLQSFYAKAGFHLVGPSAVVHGADVWYEMRIDV